MNVLNVITISARVYVFTYVIYIITFTYLHIYVYLHVYLHVLVNFLSLYVQCSTRSQCGHFPSSTNLTRYLRQTVLHYIEIKCWPTYQYSGGIHMKCFGDSGAKRQWFAWRLVWFKWDWNQESLGSQLTLYGTYYIFKSLFKKFLRVIPLAS